MTQPTINYSRQALTIKMLLNFLDRLVIYRPNKIIIVESGTPCMLSNTFIRQHMMKPHCDREHNPWGGSSSDEAICQLGEAS